MLLSEDLHIALTSATNQPRENTETWLNSLESLPELDPDSERMLQFNQVYNRFASTLSEDSICSSKYIKEASLTIPTKATPQNQKLKSIGNGKGRNTNKPSARTTIPPSTPAATPTKPSATPTSTKTTPSSAKYCVLFNSSVGCARTKCRWAHTNPPKEASGREVLKSLLANRA